VHVIDREIVLACVQKALHIDDGPSLRKKEPKRMVNTREAGEMRED